MITILVRCVPYTVREHIKPGAHGGLHGRQRRTGMCRHISTPSYPPNSKRNKVCTQLSDLLPEPSYSTASTIFRQEKTCKRLIIHLKLGMIRINRRLKPFQSRGSVFGKYFFCLVFFFLSKIQVAIDESIGPTRAFLSSTSRPATRLRICVCGHKCIGSE